MKNNERDFVYLTRVLKEPYCDFLEIYLNGGDVEQLGKPSSATVPSSVESRLDESFRDSAANAKKTAEISSYFFYAPATDDGLNDLRTRTLDLLYSPANESGAIKQNNGQKCSASELYGGDITSMLILKAPLDLLEVMGKIGLAELRSGEYGKDDERSIYDEIAIGDDGLRHILRTDKDCSIMAYGEFHNIMNNPNIFSDAKYNPFDSEKLFSSTYEPSFEVNVFDELARVEVAEAKNSKTLEQKELEEANDWFRKMKAAGMSTEDIKDLEGAFQDAENFYGTSSFEDDDLPTA